MEIKLILNTSTGVKNIAKLVKSIEEELDLKIKDKFYGSDLKKIYVGIIYVSPEYDVFFKLRKPKYYTVKEDLLGNKFKQGVVESFEYEFKLESNAFLNLNDNQIKAIIAEKLITSLISVIGTSSKIKGFDLESLKSDLESFYRDNCYLTKDQIVFHEMKSETINLDDAEDSLTDLQESIDEKTKAIEILKLLNLIAQDFSETEKHQGLDIHYQDAIKKGLERFDQSGLILDTQDEEDICTRIEELMDMVGLESSGGHLNNWRYGFDPNVPLKD